MSASPQAQTREIDMSRPHPARIYDYALGGKNHFAADREVAEKAWTAMPTGRTAARENRSFLRRAVRYLAAEQGIRQFLDIETGPPATENVHEVAQRVAPESRIVYAENDPPSPGSRASLAHQQPQGPHRLHPGRPARPVKHPGRPRKPGGHRLQPAGRADAGRHLALHLPTTITRPRPPRLPLASR
jgi:hypothetical protein